MQAHKAIELAQKVYASGDFTSRLMQHMESEIHNSIKFQFDKDDCVSVGNIKFNEAMATLKLPYPLTFIDIDKIGSILAYDDGGRYIRLVLMYDRVRFTNETDEDYRPVLLKPEIQLALDREDPSLVSLTKDATLIPVVQTYLGDQMILGMVACLVTGMAILNCSNVDTMDNEPSAALNKKRARNGKVPIYSYKTLHIRPNAPLGDSREYGIVGRNSPRVHLRRGHIRRIGEDKTIWIQSCVVGSKERGVVMKDYKVAV
jgi:hypothetical protein